MATPRNKYKAPRRKYVAGDPELKTHYHDERVVVTDNLEAFIRAVANDTVQAIIYTRSGHPSLDAAHEGFEKARKSVRSNLEMNALILGLSDDKHVRMEMNNAPVLLPAQNEITEIACTFARAAKQRFIKMGILTDVNFQSLVHDDPIMICNLFSGGVEWPSPHNKKTVRAPEGAWVYIKPGFEYSWPRMPDYKMISVFAMPFSPQP